jgi:uncharacterized C2H2 Zn-finger protein
MEPQKLKCPVCGVVYDNYRDYFTCWTSHLDEKVSHGNLLAPYEHGEAIKYYKENPQTIERGLRILAVEVGVFHGRIDLIGVDHEKRLVLIDVDNGHDPERKANQLHRYRRSIRWMGTQIFGIRNSDLPTIRLLIVNPNKYVKEA